MATLEMEPVIIEAPATRVRAIVARPQGIKGRLPGVIAWSDIFQLTRPHLRLVERLAGYGFIVLAPEIYTRIEPTGLVLDFESDRARALDDSARIEPIWIDEERRAAMDFMRSRSDVDGERLGVCGWCFGGHLAFRASLQEEVKAAACFYATGIHNGNLGAAQGSAGTLERAGEIKGEILLVWGTLDPHIPREGRGKIHSALEESGVRFETRLFDAEHAFMRDEGPRYDPEATDRAFTAMIDLFRRRL